MSVPAGDDFCAQLGKGPTGIGAGGDGAGGYPGPRVGARKERRSVSSAEAWQSQELRHGWGGSWVGGRKV